MSIFKQFAGYLLGENLVCSIVSLGGGSPPPDPNIGIAAQENIKLAREQYDVLSQERQRIFESFKSQNAMLANSRRYLPMALDELAARLQKGGADRELQGFLAVFSG